jgi:hypothetical protein
MRVYVVRPGDSPAKIASMDEHASCPKCAIDLVRANAPPKEVIVHPNGFLTFRELRVGERLRLPEKWFEPRFELLPPAYFASLPYADGVTPSPFGDMAVVILHDFKVLDVAADRLEALSRMDDATFAKSVGPVAEAISTAADPAFDHSDGLQFALAAQQDIRNAMPHGQAFSTFAAAGLAAPNARISVMEALSSGLTNAYRAIGQKYGKIQPSGH